MERLGIAVIGASMRSAMICDFVKNGDKQAYITGYYDPLPQRSQVFVDHYAFPDARVYASMDEALSDPRVGAVFIGTIDAAHAGPAIAALQASKHVYCEKPLATTLEDCAAIERTARASDKVFYMGMNLRHSPMQWMMHEMIVSGRLGRLLTIEANEYYSEGRTYFRRWNRLRKNSGGLWVTKACHDFDIINWLAGDRAKRVFATADLSFYTPRPEAGTHCRDCKIASTCPDYYDVSRDSGDWSDRLAEMSEQFTGSKRDICLYNSDKDTFDNGMAIVEYANGVRATYTLTVVTGRYTRQIRLNGTAATVEGDMEAGTMTLTKRYTREKQVIDLKKEMTGGHGGGDERICTDFLKCCQTGAAPLSGWQDGCRSVRLALAAQQSCDTGNVVDLKD